MEGIKNWLLIKEVKYLDRMDAKKYYEYTLESTNGTKIILIICDHFLANRVKFIITNYDSIYNIIPRDTIILGSKQIKNILDNTKTQSFSNDWVQSYLKCNDPLLTEQVIREFVDHYYNNNSSKI